MRQTGKTVGSVAREKDLTETAVREWVRQAERDEGKRADGLTTAERAEAQLRMDLRETREERDTGRYPPLTDRSGCSDVRIGPSVQPEREGGSAGASGVQRGEDAGASDAIAAHISLATSQGPPRFAVLAWLSLQPLLT